MTKTTTLKEKFHVTWVMNDTKGLAKHYMQEVVDSIMFDTKGQQNNKQDSATQQSFKEQSRDRDRIKFLTKETTRLKETAKF